MTKERKRKRRRVSTPFYEPKTGLAIHQLFSLPFYLLFQLSSFPNISCFTCLRWSTCLRCIVICAQIFRAIITRQQIISSFHSLSPVHHPIFFHHNKVYFIIIFLFISIWEYLPLNAIIKTNLKKSVAIINTKEGNEREREGEYWSKEVFFFFCCQLFLNENDETVYRKRWRIIKEERHKFILIVDLFEQL